MSLSILLVLCGLVRYCLTLDNGLAKVPQMGYNSWYDAECSNDMNEDYIKKQVDEFVSKGFPKLGYEYFNLDDCIVEPNRTLDGKLQSDKTRFPSSLRSLADYIHGKGLKFGLYTDRGTQTCAGRAGAQGYESVDAQTYAEWGVDYLKEDSCHATDTVSEGVRQYGLMRDALAATNRSIFFSLCGWHDWYAPMGATLGNSWRIGPDDGSWNNVLTNINIMASVHQYAGPGGWNDPCLLISQGSSGNSLATVQQSRIQFSIWSIMNAPLLISGRVVNMDPYNLETYTNAEVIAVSQNALGVPGFRVAGTDLGGDSTTNVWVKPLSNQGTDLLDYAMLFVNIGSSATNVTCDANCFKEASMDPNSLVIGRDLWTHKDLATSPDKKTGYTALVPASGVLMVRWRLA